MLGRLVLLLLQIVGGWFGANALMGYIKLGGDLRIFIFAVVCAVVIFLIGVVAAQVVKDVGTPGSHTLSWALGTALLAAVLWTFGPSVPLLDQVPWGKIPTNYAVLAGAILGYAVKR